MIHLLLDPTLQGHHLFGLSAFISLIIGCLGFVILILSVYQADDPPSKVAKEDIITGYKVMGAAVVVVVFGMYLLLVLIPLLVCGVLYVFVKSIKVLRSKE